MDPESGEPTGKCGFAMLSQAGCASASLATADERNVPSLEYLYHLAYPEKGKGPINKMRPDCRELVSIIRKCKFKIAANAAHNVINREG